MQTLQIANPVRPDELDGLRRQIIVIPDHLTSDLCREIVARVESRPKRGLAVTVPAESGTQRAMMAPDVRRTATVDLTDMDDALNALVGGIATDVMEPAYGAVDYWSRPQALFYEPGGRYDLHADSDLPELRPDGTTSWRRANERDVSLICYLNSDFEGGQLGFPFLGVTVTPAARMLVCFPSHHKFAHQAELVTAGARYALVSWASLVGTPRFHERPKAYVLNPRPGLGCPRPGSQP